MACLLFQLLLGAGFFFPGRDSFFKVSRSTVIRSIPWLKVEESAFDGVDAGAGGSEGDITAGFSK